MHCFVCHRNVQIQDLQQKICDADQGKGLKIKLLYTVHSRSCNLNWLRTMLLLVYLVTESEVWLWAAQDGEWGKSLEFMMTVDVMWKLLAFCIHRLAIVSPQKRKKNERESKECDLFKSKLSCLLQCVDREQRWQVHVGESAHHDGSQVRTQMAAGTGNIKQALTENLSFQICSLKNKKL